MHKERFQPKKYAFTLIELIFVAVIIGLIMPQMFSLYNFIIRSNKEIIARQQAIQQGYEFFERLNILMEDYTVDYEEYFNRQMVGCVGTGVNAKNGKNFKRNVGLSGYCTNFTAYGNENGNLTQSGGEKYHDIYYCSSKKSQQADLGHTRVIHPVSHCGTVNNGITTFGNNAKQSYGQYAALFKDVKGGDGNLIVGGNDDEELGYLINTDVDAIGDSDNIKELYLISHDGTRRLYFRRKLDRDDGNGHKQYKIQILRLRGFDAGRKHDFSQFEKEDDNKGLYDGVIDTWACDYSMGFEGHGNPIDAAGGAYSEYHLPRDSDDCRIDLTQGSTDLFAWNISISPRGDADLYWAKEDYQINSYMKIMIINKIYFPSIFGSNNRISDTIKDFIVPLETTINMKDFYRG